MSIKHINYICDTKKKRWEDAFILHNQQEWQVQQMMWDIMEQAAVMILSSLSDTLSTAVI